MASITQNISQYNGGISQQPDEKKLPGQVIEAKNVLPDITRGLLKRPGGKLVGSLSDGDYNSEDNGRWFHYYRDENEQYIGQISRAGVVRIWKCDNGVEMHVENDTTTSAALVSYLTHTDDEHLQSLTLNDYTYITNRTKTTAMAATVEPVRPPEAFIQLKKVAYANQYSVNLFDNNTTEEVKTATRVKVASSSLDTESSCPNVGTEIFKVGTDNQDLTNVKQKFKVSLATIGNSSDNNFFEDDASRAYSLIYVPPAWAVDTYYETGDLVQGEADNTRIYKRTGAGYTSSGTVPIHDSGEVDGWTAVTTATYAANADVESTQLYHGQACIEISDSRQIDSKEDLDLTVAAWAAGNGVNFPFEISSTTWDGEYANLIYIWKHYGEYSDQISRIIFRRTNGTTHTIGGNNVESAADGALATNNGSISVSRIGWGVQSRLPAGRKDLYFRLTTTGQAVPNTGATDYTCRYTTIIDLLHGGSGFEVGDKLQVKMKDGTHIIEIEEISKANVQANLGLIRPSPTSFDTKTTVTAESIIGDLRSDILGDSYGGTNDKYEFQDNSASGYQVKQIGNGLYITRPEAEGVFNISSPSGELLNVLTDSIDDIADLPTQCKHGYVVKVANSEAEEDDYYLKFFGNLNINPWEAGKTYALNDKVINDNGRKYVCTVAGASDSSGGPTGTGSNITDNVARWDYTELADEDYLDGRGVWEECPEPGVKITFDPATMPIQIVRNDNVTADQSGATHGNGWFKVEQISWENRLVGDTVTVPEPSFIGQTVNKMIFFRNRLVMLSDENVIMSQPGDFFNFWPKSAITFTATDNIDLSCSSEYPAIVYDGLQVNSGLVLFTKNQQFMLTTDSDVLSPLTAKINSLSTYNFNNKTNPISLGTTIGFLDNAGKYSRFWEMAKVLREGEPDVVDQTKVVSQLFDNEINKISNSRENGVIFFSKKGGSTLYGFRYFNTSTQRLQQSWFTWEIVGTIQHHAVLDDSLYIVVRQDNNKDTLQKYSIKTDTDSITVTDDKNNVDATDDVTYRIHLDGASSYTIPADTYNESTNKTVFTKPAGYENTTAQLCVYDHNTTSDSVGKYAEADIVNINIEVPGDWSNRTVILGYLFDMQIKFPTIYYTQVENESVKADTNGSLIIHRIKLNFGPYGSYSTTIDRLGKDPYTEIWESSISDQYLLSNVAIDDEVTRTIPTYERNKNLSITLKSTHPSPATLYSMAWEGDYTSKFYKRV